MDKTIAGLLSAIGALATITPVQAAPVLQAASYAELLRPVPNALETLRALDEADVERVQLGPIVRDLVGGDRRHHHHHHHRYYRRHHHHHHQYRDDYRRRDDDRRRGSVFR